MHWRSSARVGAKVLWFAWSITAWTSAASSTSARATQRASSVLGCDPERSVGFQLGNSARSSAKALETVSRVAIGSNLRIQDLVQLASDRGAVHIERRGPGARGLAGAHDVRPQRGEAGLNRLVHAGVEQVRVIRRTLDDQPPAGIRERLAKRLAVRGVAIDPRSKPQSQERVELEQDRLGVGCGRAHPRA